MGTFIITLPDVGEGIAEAELTEWDVSVGDIVKEDDVLGTVMTDKAAVEVPTSVSGKIKWLCGEPGDSISIGSRFAEIEVDGKGNVDLGVAEVAVESVTPKETAPEPEIRISEPATIAPAPVAPTTSGSRPLAAPSVRQRARDLNIHLSEVLGSGPAGRIIHDDLDRFLQGHANPLSRTRQKAHGTTEIKIIGMRRRIAEKMTLSKARIPHITIVEEIDVTSLELLRTKLNNTHANDRGKLTILPFIAQAIAVAVRTYPEMNATFDDDAGVVTQYRSVNIGIAAQTPAGLAVPVIKAVESHSLWDTSNEISRVSQAARDGKATLAELSGSSITITSLGALGALATTPIINHPEVAIVGVNKMAIRPMWDGQDFAPRKMMNLSSSFDHRVIDGWDAAVFVQKLKELLETPAFLFIEV